MNYEPTFVTRKAFIPKIVALLYEETFLRCEIYAYGYVIRKPKIKFVMKGRAKK